MLFYFMIFINLLLNIFLLLFTYIFIRVCSFCCPMFLDIEIRMMNFANKKKLNCKRSDKYSE